MLDLILFHAGTLAVCIALGVGTAWWMFRGDRAPLAKPPKQFTPSEQGDKQ